MLLSSVLHLLSPAQAGSCDGGTVRVVTANAWGLPAPIAKNRRRRMARIEQFLDGEAYDIVGLQEAWKGALPHFEAPVMTGPQSRDSGLGLRSPYAVEDATLHTFEAERGFDAWKAKGLLTARVDIPGRALNVAVTHLQSGRGEKNAGVRRAQVEEMLGWIEGEGPWLLMGDFNFYDSEPTDLVTHQRLVDAGFVDIGLAGGAEQGTYPGLPDRFDRVYARTPCELDSTAHVIDASGLSDHHFVSVDLRF